MLTRNWRVTSPPGLTGSSMKDLDRNSSGTSSSAVAKPLALNVDPTNPVSSPVVLTYSPGVAAVTSTVTVQLDIAPTCPPEKEKESVPEVAVGVPAMQSVVALAGVAMTSPTGKVSSKIKFRT